MQIKNVVAISVLLFLLALGCSDTKKEVKEEPLFSVGEKEVYQGDFVEYYIKHLISTGRNDTRENRYEYLNELIDQLILGKAAFQNGIEDEPSFKQFQQLQNKKALRDYFFLLEMEKTPIEVSDKESRIAYERSKSKRYIRQLFFTDQSTAELYQNRLKQGESFVKLANELFKTPRFDSTAGFLGEVGYFSIDDAVAEAVYSLPVGAISPIVQSRWGLHILKVEHELKAPLLAEDQYKTAKKGISSQVKLRRQRLQGDAFVKSFMTTTKPVFNEALMIKMGLHIKDFHRRKLQKSDQSKKVDMVRFEAEDLPAILEGFQSDEVLASYTIDGSKHVMTVGDFASWLPDMLPSEVTNRFGASVGRALRNEAFAKKGLAIGLSKDPQLLHDVDLRKHFYASDWFFNKVVASLDTSGIDIDRKTLDSYLQQQARFGLKVEYLFKTYATLNEALQAKAVLQTKNAKDLEKNGFKRIKKAEQPGDPFYKLIQDSPMQTLSAGINLNEQPVLIYVQERSTSSSLENTASFRQVFVKKTAVDKFLTQLKSNVVVKVDSSAFELLYSLHQ